MAERRRFLDEPFIVQRVALEQVQELVRPLAHSASPLPGRMRHRCASMARRCSLMARELRRAPEHVRAERHKEDAAAARRPPPPRS